MPVLALPGRAFFAPRRLRAPATIGKMIKPVVVAIVVIVSSAIFQAAAAPLFFEPSTAEVPTDSGKASPLPAERDDRFAGHRPSWCPRAQKWAERHVCGDADLSALDVRMESYYFAAFGRTASDAQLAFRRQQLDWIQSWWIACGIGPYGTGVPVDIGLFRSCLKDHYSNRIMQLGGAVR